MDQTFQVFIQPCKGSKLGQVGDGTFHQLAFLEMGNFYHPWIWQQLTNGKADALALLVNGDHLDLDFLAHF